MTEPTTFDIPRDQVPRELRARELSLDLADCSCFSVLMKIGEFEKAAGHRFDQWPDAIRARMEREVAAWIERNPTSQVKAITQGVENGFCILALHWRPKP
jgi:hypothetical protein